MRFIELVLRGVRYKGTFDISFGIEHRMRKEEMEEQFNKEAKQGWTFAADATRITDENASSEDRKHTSGGVFVAVDSNLGAVIGKEDGAVTSVPGNEGAPRTAASMEVVKQARTTRHPVVDCLRCDTVSRRLQEDPFVPR